MLSEPNRSLYKNVNPNDQSFPIHSALNDYRKSSESYWGAYAARPSSSNR